MASRRKSRRVKPGAKANWFYAFALMLVILIGLGVMASQAESLRKQEAQKALYLSQIEQAQLEKEDLELLLSYVTSDEYKRSVAYEQLGLLAPNEIRFVSTD